MVGDLAGVLKALWLYQHHLELSSGVNIDDLVAAALRLDRGAVQRARAVHPLGAVPALRDGSTRRRLKLLEIVLVLILVGVGPLLQLIQNAHDGPS